jgi:hypothetical protein
MGLAVTQFDFLVGETLMRNTEGAQNSVNLKYSLILTGMFRFKPASQFAEK